MLCVVNTDWLQAQDKNWERGSPRLTLTEKGVPQAGDLVIGRAVVEGGSLLGEEWLFEETAIFHKAKHLTNLQNSEQYNFSHYIKAEH